MYLINFNEIIFYFLRFLYLSELMKQEKNEIHNSFEKFLTEAPEKPTVDAKLIEHILEIDHSSPKHQFLILAAISNYHKYGYPSLKDEGGIIYVKNIT